MPAFKSILSISRDEVLQQTRNLILQQAGFHVFPAYSDEDAIALLTAAIRFDLVLMCHTVPEESRKTLVTRAKQLYPKIPVLVMSDSCDFNEKLFDGSMHNLDTPEAMLRMVSVLTRNAQL